jgi:hypothetical protein
VQLDQDIIMKKIIALVVGTLFASVVMAKLPPPSDEAAAKAEETKDKATWSGKVAAYKLCLVQDKTVAYYLKTKAPAGKPMDGLPPCADPGPYVATAVVLNKDPVKK